MNVRSILFMLAASVSVVSVDASAQSKPWGDDVSVEKITITNAGHYTIDNGLTSSYITCLERDCNGLIWLGTNDGINAFDGYGFRGYVANQEDSTTIQGKKISDVKDIDNYYLLAAMADGGLALYDKRTDRFMNVNIDDAPENHSEFRSAYGICKMGTTAYVAFENNIIRIDLTTGDQNKIVMMPRKKHTGSNIERMELAPMPDNRHIAMMLSKTTFGVLDTRTDRVKTIRLNKEYINDICPLDETHCYICTTKGLKIYDVSTGQFSQERILNNTLVQAITKDYGIGFWIAYDNNHLLKWIPSRNKVKEVSNISFFLDKRTSVNDVIEDENEILWLATSNAGLIKLDAKHPKIKNIEIDAPDLPLNYITHDIYARRSHDIWAACGIDGALRVNTKTQTIERIPIPHRNVYSVLVRKSDEVIFGTTWGALRYTPNAAEKFEPIPIKDAVLDSIGGRCIINNICEDCLGNLWFATQIGVYKYNGLTAKRYASASHGLENVNMVYEDGDGRIWSGTISGSFVMEPGDSVFTETKSCELNYGDNNNTNCFVDYDNSVLIGTSSGVLVYNKESHEVKKATFGGHFNQAMIYSITTDENGVIWLSTNRGVGYIDGNFNQVYLFNQHDGLSFQGNECHKFARYKNYIYIGNATNLNFIKADILHFNDTQPKAFVSSVEYGQSGGEERAVMENDTLFTVRYLVRAALKVRVASSDFTFPSRNEFMYRLDNDDWVRMVGNNEILLSGPLPGTYRLEIRATNSDKTWSETTKTVYIKIVPPLWFSTPAVVFYVILALTGTWFLIDIRFRSMKRRMKQVENEAKAKSQVEAQKNRLAVLHRDQENSIRYAKRIQESLMPPVSTISGLFNKMFVYYSPRDIVSGDFYSFYHRDDMTFIIAADCTGHGVPGAFISILGIDHLYNIIMRQKIDDAGTILTYLHRDLHSTVFRNENSREEFNEGMDLTVCVVYHKEKRINFAGAMNDLYLIRDNEILTYHGDRHSIGTNSTLGEVDDKQYASQVIYCQPGDMFYMFSDGFVDQFGGPENKKFKHRRFKQLLLYLHKLPAKDQKNMLNRRFLEWRGINDQTDDVSVIGFEPWA